MLLKVDFLVRLDGFRLPVGKVFVEFEFVGRLPDQFENLPSGKNRRVDDTTFLVDSNDVTFGVRNRPLVAGIFLNVDLFENNFGCPILDRFRVTPRPESH